MVTVTNALRPIFERGAPWRGALLLAWMALSIGGCRRTLSTEAPGTRDDPIRAIYDPSDPIPVLRSVPWPTALHQAWGADDTPRAALDVADVRPPACMPVSVDHCIGLLERWPDQVYADIPVSGAVDLDSVARGVRWFVRSAADAPLEPVEFTAEILARSAPPSACQTEDNGSDPSLRYEESDVPSERILRLQPTAQLPSRGQHFVGLWGDEDGVVDQEGRPLRASAVYDRLLKAADAVNGAGVILDANLKALIEKRLLARLGVTRLADLSEADRQTLETLRTQVGERLFRMRRHLRWVRAALDAEIDTRGDPVWMNGWTVAPRPVPFPFNVRQGLMPYPNVALHAVVDDTSPTGLRPNVVDAAPGRRAALEALDGFSTQAAILIPTSSVVPEATWAAIEARSHPLLDGTPEAGALATWTRHEGNGVVPLLELSPPVLEPDRTHLFTLVRSVDASTQATDPALADPIAATLRAGTELRRSDDALTAAGTVLGACLPWLTGEGPVATDDGEQKDWIDVLEDGWQADVWRAAFRQAKTAHPDLAESDILLAWTHHTASLRAEPDAWRNERLRTDGWEQLLSGARIQGPDRVLDEAAAIAAQLNSLRRLCVPACRAGETTVDPGACGTEDAPAGALATDATCTALIEAETDGIGRLERYQLQAYALTAGSPFAGATWQDAPTVHRLDFWLARPTGSATVSSALVFALADPAHRAEDMLATAGAWARSGFTTVALDLPFQGGRVSDLIDDDTGLPCAPFVDPADVQCSAGGPCNGGCDGVPDGRAAGFSLAHPLAQRDALRQGALDLMTLIRALEVEGGALDGGPTLSPNERYLVAEGRSNNVGLMVLTSVDFDAAAVVDAGGHLAAPLLTEFDTEASRYVRSYWQSIGACDPAPAGEPCATTPNYLRNLVETTWFLDRVDSVALANAFGTAWPPLAVVDSQPWLAPASTNFQAALTRVRSDAESVELPVASGDNVCHESAIVPFPGDSPPEDCLSCFGRGHCSRAHLLEQISRFFRTGTAPSTDVALPASMGGIACECP